VTRLLLIATILGAGSFYAIDVAPSLDVAGPTQDKVQVKILNGDRVYRPSTLRTGQRVLRTKPAVLKSRKVFAATPEYKQIKKRKLDPSSAEAILLRKRASDRFKSAIRRAASQGGYDLIAEKGAIKVEGGQPQVITQQVINLLQ